MTSMTHTYVYIDYKLIDYKLILMLHTVVPEENPLIYANDESSLKVLKDTHFVTYYKVIFLISPT